MKHLDGCMQTGDPPSWILESWTVPVQKVARKGNALGNYRATASLNHFWKLVTGIINEKVYNHLNQQNILPEEQEGCRQRIRGTKDQLLMDNAVFGNSRRRKINLTVAWVDFQEPYDMVPCSWMLKTQSWNSHKHY